MQYLYNLHSQFSLANVSFKNEEIDCLEQLSENEKVIQEISMSTLPSETTQQIFSYDLKNNLPFTSKKFLKIRNDFYFQTIRKCLETQIFLKNDFKIKNELIILNDETIDMLNLVWENRSYILNTFKEISIEFNEKLQNELYSLSKNELNLENLLIISQMCKARDTLVVWKEIPNFSANPNIANIKIEWDMEKLNSIKELLDMANQFEEWINLNKISDYPLSINLKNKNLISIPREISLLEKTGELNLSKNKIIFTSWEFLEKLKHLSTLSLNEIGIDSVPEKIWKLTNLVFLKLAGNKISTISDKINNISSYYAKLRGFGTLCIIDLRNNPLLISLPKILSQSKNIIYDMTFSEVIEYIAPLNTRVDQDPRADRVDTPLHILLDNDQKTLMRDLNKNQSNCIIQ